MSATERWFGPGAFGACKSCGQSIRWLLTPHGKLMPTDAATVGPDETHFDHRRHTSHFASCQQADFWRRRDWEKKKAAPEGGL